MDLEKSPYPRRHTAQVRQRKLRFLRAWLLFGTGLGFVILGCAWFAMKPTVNYYNATDLLIGLLWVFFGLIVRRSAQADLMRLKGLEREEMRFFGGLGFWLPWYLRLPDKKPLEAGYDEPPSP